MCRIIPVQSPAALWPLAAVAVLLLAPAAFAQPGTIVVCSGDCPPAPQGAQLFADIDDAFAEVLANANINTVQIFDLGSPWIADNPIPTINRAGFTIEGKGNPEDIIVRSTASPVMQISATDVTIEGITLEGDGTAGQDVIRVVSGSAVINQVYITGGGAHGVHVMGGTAIVVNSVSIGNGDDGIHAVGDVNVQFSTIKDNTGDGIEITGGNATVKNNIIASNGGIGLNVTGGTVTNDFNDVWNNGAGDYFGAAAGAGSLSVDPSFLPDGSRAWDGQIASVDGGGGPNPVTDIAETPADGTVLEWAIVDFDGDPRPTLNPPTGGPTANDMGADEVNTGGTAGVWVECYVQPEPVGAIAIGQLRVDLTISDFGGLFATDNFGGATTKVVLVPELVDGTVTLADLIADDGVDDGTTDSPITIPIAITFASGNTFVGTNAVPIPLADTQIENSDTIFDGRARVVVIDGGVELSPLPGSQAVDGRFVLIDTKAPEIQLPTNVDGVTADFFITPPPPPAGHNDTLQTNVPTVSTNDQVPGFLTNGPQVASTLIRRVRGGQGAKIFFNVGQLYESNFGGSAGRNLEFVITLTLEDVQPDPDNPVTLGGFRPELIGTHILTVDQIQNGATNLPGMPLLLFGEDKPVTLDGNVEVIFTPNMTVPVTELGVEWRFTGPHAMDYLQFFPTPDLTRPPTQEEIDGVHWQIRFQPTDAAGIPAPEDTLLDPLNVWWQLRAKTDLGGSGGSLPRPQFFWELDRGNDPGDSGELNPQFAYRLLESPTGDAVGPYVPVTHPDVPADGWYSWDFRRQLTYRGFFEPLSLGTPNLVGRQLLLVVLGVDEAGNVEPWPSDVPGSGIINAGVNAYQLTSAERDAGDNWVRFQIDPQPDIETSLIANFWHDQTNTFGLGQRDAGENQFGDARVIPLPDAPNQVVAAEFTATTLFDSVQNVGVEIVLLDSRGTELIPPTQLPLVTGNTVPFVIWGAQVLPGAPPPQPPFFFPNANTGPVPLGDPDGAEPRTYTLQVRTIQTENGPPGDPPNPILIADSTPVNYYFAVVPNVAEYIENRTSPDFQPIKTVETN